MGREFHPIIFFDGVCSVCNHTVDFIIRRDPGLFLFAPLQGTHAKEKLDPRFTGEDLKSIVLLDEQGVHVKSKAMLRILSRLNWPWKFMRVFLIFPAGLRDFFYDIFASHRYQWFGKRDTCRLPSPEERKRFLT